MSRESTAPGLPRFALGGGSGGERTERTERVFAALLTALFLAVTIPVMLHHEMWRDEVQAWLLARDARTMGDLFRALHYEGHPALWYLLLRPIATVLHDPRWVQPLSLAFSGCTVYLFARFAPFSRLVRVLFAFGYFVVYGYTIVARSYGLGLTLTVLLCVLLASRKPRYGSAGVVMLLLANTSVYGSMLVAACMAGLAAEALLGSRSGITLRDRIRRVALPVLVGGVGVVLAAVQSWPASDNEFQGPGVVRTTHVEHFSPGVRPIAAMAPIWRAYAPMPRLERLDDLWWANFLVDRSPKGAVLAGVLSILIVIALALAVRRSVLALTLYLTATVILMLFSVMIYGGSLYHHGYFFLAAVMALWLAAAAHRRSSDIGVDSRSRFTPLRLLDRYAQLPVVVFLTFQVIGGAFRMVADYIFPFSEGEAAADYIRSHKLGQLPVATSPGFNGTTVGAYLGRPVFSLDREMVTTFTPLSVPAADVDDSQLLARLSACCVRADSAAILVLGHELEAVADSSLSVRPLVALNSSLAPERFFLYEVSRSQ